MPDALTRLGTTLVETRPGEAAELHRSALALYTEIVPADITYKHEQMKTGAFPFLRATFYRWAQEWTKINADVAKAPIVLAVGDLHVENF